MNPMNNPTWRCHCGKPVMADLSGAPASKYYSVENKEVYCSVECGLNAYQLRKNLNTQQRDS